MLRLLGSAVLATTLVLAGCSGGDDGAASSTDAAVTTPPATAATPRTTVAPTAPVVSTSAVPTSAVPTSAPGNGGSSTSPQGFERVSVTVDALTELCLWLAATSAQRQQGLMGVTSLGSADGMLFDFDGISTGEFWMYQTLLPLSIAFYDADGAFVSSTDMDPCTTASSVDCARYGADAPYATAIEVAQGDLERLGLVPGSRIEQGGDCTPT